MVKKIRKNWKTEIQQKPIEKKLEKISNHGPTTIVAAT